jgi:hypothetical protein
VTHWRPATEAEAAMHAALDSGDQELYFQILSRMELFLPISSEAIAGRAPMGWGTWTAGERTHVLAFTSSEAMHACLAEHAGSARRIPYHELAAAWPNLEWWLAVNPGLPIEGYLPAWFVSQLARGDARLPSRDSQPAHAERAETLGRAERAETLGRAERAESLGRAERAESLGRVTLPARRALGWAAAERAMAVAERAAPLARRAGGAGASGPDLARPGSTGPGDAGTGGAVPGVAVPEAPPGDSTAYDSPAPADEQPPALQPANSLEAELLETASAGNTDTLLSILLLAKVLLPVADGADPSVRPGDERFAWRTEQVDDRPCVVVFTSTDRLTEHLGEQREALGVRFVQLLRTWADPTWSLVVNPDTPIAVHLRASSIMALASSAAEVGLDDSAGEASESEAGRSRQAAAVEVEQPPAMQKVIAPSQVAWYLERGYDRVSGFVHRAAEVAHLRTPADLASGLGLRYDGSPFPDGADEVFVLRWPAYIPSLYRIPYGGRTEAAMAAMEGWVIERAPFRGNGFAPADSGDVIAEFKVDSVRLPHGAQLWRLRADGTSQLLALLDADGPTWVRVEES